MRGRVNERDLEKDRGTERERGTGEINRVSSKIV